MEIVGGLMFLAFMIFWGFYKMVKLATGHPTAAKTVGRAVFFRLFR